MKKKGFLNLIFGLRFSTLYWPLVSLQVGLQLALMSPTLAETEADKKAHKDKDVVEQTLGEIAELLNSRRLKSWLVFRGIVSQLLIL